MKRLLYAVILVSLLSACQAVAPPVARVAPEPAATGAEDTAALMTLLSKTYGGLVMAGDAAGYADLYSEDVLWAPPNGPDQTSKEGIRNGIQGLFDKFEFQVNPQLEEVVIQGDFAYVIGTVDGVLTPRAGGDPLTIKFRVFWLLQRESGVWKISRQIWNNKPVDMADVPPVPQAEDVAPEPAESVEEDKMANALSAGPRSVTDKAAVLDWPSETNPEFSELRAGTNGWTCITDNPKTPVNDPMCLDEQWMVWLSAYAQGTEPEITELGWSYMLQGGAAVSDADPFATLAEGEELLIDPPHLMVLVPGELDTSRFPTDRDSGEPYLMWADTPYEHFMLPLDPDEPPQADEKIQNAMSAGPSEISQEATILDYPEGWPGNWPNEPTEEYIEIRPGSNGWGCVVDNPTTPGNDPMCLNETQLAMVQARNALIDPPSTGYGVGYMLQGGGPVGTPPHIMVYTPGSREDLIALSTEMNPLTWANGWNMYADTPYAHMMVAVPAAE